ncbi:unnamed protein product, partial [Didymodactylos carnosus]
RTFLEISATVVAIDLQAEKKQDAKKKNQQSKAKFGLGNDEEDSNDEEFQVPRRVVATPTITTISQKNVDAIQQTQQKKKPSPQLQENDFPALPTTQESANKTAVQYNSVWNNQESDETSMSKPTTASKKKKQPTKKKSATKQDIDPQITVPITNFSSMGLSELGQRLLNEDENNDTTVSTPIVKTKQQMTSEENKQKNTSTKNVSTVSDAKKNDPKPNLVTKNGINEENHILEKKTNNTKTIERAVEPVSVSGPPPPPGFNTSSSVTSSNSAQILPLPPPGFEGNSILPTVPTYLYPSTYQQSKDLFRAKLYELFDGDMNLLSNYEKFCDAFITGEIDVQYFIKKTLDLFKDKSDDYILNLLLLIPNIEKQNEIYKIWLNEVHPKQTNNCWNKVVDSTHVQCHLCQQLLLPQDYTEHTKYHPEFQQDYPELPTKRNDQFISSFSHRSKLK